MSLFFMNRKLQVQKLLVAIATGNQIATVGNIVMVIVMVIVTAIATEVTVAVGEVGLDRHPCLNHVTPIGTATR